MATDSKAAAAAWFLEDTEPVSGVLAWHSLEPEIDVPAWIIDDLERQQQRRDLEREIQIELDPTVEQPPPDEDEP